MFDLGDYVGIAAVVAVMIGVLIAYCVAAKHENNAQPEPAAEPQAEIPQAESGGFWGKAKKSKQQAEYYQETEAEAQTDIDDLSKRIVESIEEQQLRNAPEPKFQATFRPEDHKQTLPPEGETMVLGGMPVQQEQPAFDDEKTLFMSKEDLAPALGVVAAAAMGDDAEEVRLDHSENSHVLMPEKPLAFGYKMAWLAIPNTKSATVLSSLGLTDIKPANWTQGLTTAYEDKKALFVTPVLNGWVLVIGRALWSKADLNRSIKDIPWFRDLSESFDDYCYFSTMRGLENHGWLKVENGALVRAYGVSGELEEVVWCFGNPTKEELAINQGFPSPAEVAESPVMIDEKNVLQMAALWSIDTTFTDRQYGPDLGFIGKI